MHIFISIQGFIAFLLIFVGVSIDTTLSISNKAITKESRIKVKKTILEYVVC